MEEEAIVVFRGSWHFGNMGNLLRHLPSLGTLIWEDFISRNMTRGDKRLEVFLEKLFNPLNMLQQLSTTHGDRLAQLSLFIDDAGDSAFILRDQANVSFKDFVQLKDLEFDIGLLRLDED